MKYAAILLALPLLLCGRADAADDWDGDIDCEGHYEDNDWRCFAYTIGRSVAYANQYVASLVYECHNDGGEWM